MAFHARIPRVVLASSLLAVLHACGSDGGPASLFDPDGSGGQGGGGSEGGASGLGGTIITPVDGSSPSDAQGVDVFQACADGGCTGSSVCRYGVCIPELGSCQKHDDCPGDSYCDTDRCVPYGVPSNKTNDPTCQRQEAPAGVAPTAQCEWQKPADGDITADYVNVYTTPVVADLNLDLDPNKLRPSVVMLTFAMTKGRTGMLRVFDGRTCEEQMRIGGPDDPEVSDNRPAYGTQVAIGDLDNDVGKPNGHPEIVTLHRVGYSGTSDPLTLIAYGIETTTGEAGVAPHSKLVRRFVGRRCGAGEGGTDEPYTFSDNQSNFGPGIWDLDDDGKPEIVVDNIVFDSNGCVLNPIDGYSTYITHGVMTTVADVDLDGKPELVRHDGVYAWNATRKRWDLEPYFTRDTSVHKPGHVAVANLGSYSTIDGHPATNAFPEIIVVSAEDGFDPDSTGTIRVQTITGHIVFGPVPLHHKAQPYGGHGGPPTASDFDGDGQVEFAAAANEFYTVYDPDCSSGAGSPDAGLPERPGGRCMRADSSLPDGILWAQPSSDYSSSETGSSIFDFNGDGISEAVYRDECYVRVYEGPTGRVIFSAPASSGTGQELPVVADVNGNFHTQIVVARATNGPSVRADGGTKGCAPVDDLFPASGAFQKTGGFIVYRDPEDRWMASRPIWNQHAYSITNVNDDATIPRSRDVLRNWEQPGLNNFRQNTQGKLGKQELADLTVVLADLGKVCAWQGGKLDLWARVCNRGTNPVQDGAAVGFYSRGRATDAASEDGSVPGALACATTTDRLLNPGDCTNVTCSGSVPAGADVFVIVDPDGKIADCHPGNNDGASAVQLCPRVN